MKFKSLMSAKKAQKITVASKPPEEQVFIQLLHWDSFINQTIEDAAEKGENYCYISNMNIERPKEMKFLDFLCYCMDYYKDSGYKVFVPESTCNKIITIKLSW